MKSEPKTRTIYRVLYRDGSKVDYVDKTSAFTVWDNSPFNPTLQKIEIEL